MFHKSGFIREQYKLGGRRQMGLCLLSSSCSKLGNSVWRIYWEVWVSPSLPSHNSPSLGGWGEAKGHHRHGHVPSWCSAPRSSWLSSSTLPRLLGKHQKWERWIKTGHIFACVHGLWACMSVHVCVYKYVGACARVRVCMQKPQHGTGYLPWLFSTICPKVGSLDEAERGYVLPSCSVDPWTLDYTGVPFYMPGF